MRPLEISTMDNRAMQKLSALAPELIADMTGDHTSYGFRRGRSTKETCEKTVYALAGEMLTDMDILRGH